jgi:hypothetical protein
MKKLSIIFFITLLAISCYVDNEEELYGPVTCDTSAITYANDILPIINNSCATSGCHEAGNTAIGDFSTYAGVKAKVDNGTFTNRVLVQKDMPPAAPLSNCEQAKIQQWINDGALNN